MIQGVPYDVPDCPRYPLDGLLFYTLIVLSYGSPDFSYRTGGLSVQVLEEIGRGQIFFHVKTSNNGRAGRPQRLWKSVDKGGK